MREFHVSAFSAKPEKGSDKLKSASFLILDFRYLPHGLRFSLVFHLKDALRLRGCRTTSSRGVATVGDAALRTVGSWEMNAAAGADQLVQQCLNSD
jgi:hypothetical protein